MSRTAFRSLGAGSIIATSTFTGMRAAEGLQVVKILILPVARSIAARIMGIMVDVKNVANAKFADREHPPIEASITAQLIGLRLNRFSLAGEVECLPQENAWQSQIRLIFAHFVGFTTRKSSDTQRVVEAEP